MKASQPAYLFADGAFIRESHDWGHSILIPSLNLQLILDQMIHSMPVGHQKSLHRELAKMRAVKSTAELAVMRTAANISSQAFVKVS